MNISNIKKWILKYKKQTIDSFRSLLVKLLLLTAMSILFIFLAKIVVESAIYLSYHTFLNFYDSDQNSTLVNMTSFVNQNSSDFVSIFVNIMLTLGLIIFSALSLSSAHDTLKQSEKQHKQFQDEQRIRDIEKRLEYFYIPADDIINNDRINKSHRNSIDGYSPSNDDGLKKIRKYSYLADKATYEAYETYLKSNCTKLKPITCQDKYKNDPMGFNKCEFRHGSCYNLYPRCEHNLDYCEHYEDCPPKDEAYIIIDNTKCKYYIDLKNKITTDIENYKNKLLRLKG